MEYCRKSDGMDRGAIEGVIDDASVGSGSYRRSYKWCERWIREL